MTVRVFVTGGTFDKEYNELTGELFFRNTHVEEMLRRGRCAIEVDVQMLMMLDSLEMSETHRAHIAQACVDCDERQIVITHGTDTMVETASRIADAVHDKTVVLTGAMIPYAFGSSDGLFNLGSALSFVQTLPPGVYIAMNGRCFPWNNVRKNRERGVFEAIVQARMAYSVEFEATLFTLPGKGGWTFAEVPADLAPPVTHGWGRTPVRATLAGFTWDTSVWRERSGRTLLPVSAVARQGRKHGDVVTLVIEFTSL